MNPSPTTEERIWAVISHLSALAFGMGMLLPIIGWSEQRHKSRYASFQCLQALGYQSLGYTVWLLTYLVLMVLSIILLSIAALIAENNGTSPGPVNVVWAGIVLFFVFGLIAVYLLLPVIAAVACALGRDFHYPILGTRLALSLGYEPAPTEAEAASMIGQHEERWVASMGHFSIIIALWGLIAPLTTWILQGKRNPFLRFQSIQTVVYQAFVNLLYLAAMVVYFVGIVIFVAVLGLEGGNPNTTTGISALLLFLFTLIGAALIMLAIPLFHILGQWAGYRVLKGDNYHYPLIGRLVEKQLTKSSGVQEPVPASSGTPLTEREAP